MKLIHSETYKRSILLIIVVSIIFFIFSGFVLDSSLNNIPSLSRELSSAPETIYNYTISKVPPFKYRVLFSTLVKNTYNVFSEPQNNENFYIVYILWSGLSYVAAALSFYLLLKTLKFNEKYALSGVFLFILSPAVLFAYSMPVHTREDFLAYTLLNISIIYILKDNLKGVLIFALLGILCRETLLIIPFMYLFFSRTKILNRIIVVILSFAVFFGVRYLTGYKAYNIFGLGFFYNIENIGESLGFLFLAFSFMWPIYFYDIWNYFRSSKIFPNQPISFIRKSSFAAFGLIFITTLLGGRINEVRLLFLLFPWVISIFLFYIKFFKEPIPELFKSSTYRIYLFITALIIFSVYFIVSSKISHFISGIYDVPYHQWILLTCLYLFVFCAGIPVYLKLFKSGNLYKYNPLLNSK